MNSLKSFLYHLLILILAAVFLISGGLLIRDLVKNHRQQKGFDQLSSLFPTESSPAPLTKTTPPPAGKAASGTPAPQEETTEASSSSVRDITAPEWKNWWESQWDSRFPVYQSLQQKNQDMIGWVRIEGTPIDYPVCFTPGQPEYYLHRDFDRNNSSYGTPFLDSSCQLETPRSSLIIYGHHMKNGSMFASLQNYEDGSWSSLHPYIQFDTLEDAGSYEVAAAIRLSASQDNTSWRQLLFPADKQEFDLAWKTVQTHRFCDTGVDLIWGDELLALVTCEYTQQDGRLMVIARRIL